MYKIDKNNLMFAWMSEDLMQDIERETAFVVKTLPPDVQEQTADTVLFTTDERLFFQQHIHPAMCMLFAMFQKFSSVEGTPFFIDETPSFEWSELSSKVSGFTVINRRTTFSGYNPVRLKLIDYDARRFLTAMVIHEWYKLTATGAMVKQSEQRMSDIYASLFCNLSYLRLHEYTKSYMLTL